VARLAVHPRAIEIMNAFPELFRPGPRSLQQTLMNKGFKCGEGWYPLIKGFLGHAQLIAHEDSLSLRVREVKQVQGHLQIHISGANERLWEVMRYAERISGFICEGCGGPSQAAERGGQVTTLCAACLRRPDVPASWREEPDTPVAGAAVTKEGEEKKAARRRELATVGALLQKLQKLDPNLPIVVEGDKLGPDRKIDHLELLRTPMSRQPEGKLVCSFQELGFDEGQIVRIQTEQHYRF